MRIQTVFRSFVGVALLCSGLSAPSKVQAWVVYPSGGSAYYNHGYTPRYYYYTPGLTYYSYPRSYYWSVPGQPYYYYNRPYYGSRNHFGSRRYGYGFRPRCR